MRPRDIQRVITALLPLPGVVTPARELVDFMYGHLAQCVLSAVYAPGAKAQAERNVVQRYSQFTGLNPMFRPARNNLLPIERQQPVHTLIELADSMGVDIFGTVILRNSQRTSTRGGILKAEASYRFAQILGDFGIQYLQDVFLLMDNDPLITALETIPGQRYHVGISYFFMLVGSETHIKNDRMVTRFLTKAVKHRLSDDEAIDLIAEAVRVLQPKYPHITPRILDNCIWEYQRKQHEKR